jgi:hypothetical protein
MVPLGYNRATIGAAKRLTRKKRDLYDVDYPCK